MPSGKGEKPKVYVGETSYDRIDIDNIKVIGCTGKNNPTNFMFDDGNHVYKYTVADSQLHMNFNNKAITCEEWDVVYAPDPYDIFGKIADMVCSQEDLLIESEPVDYNVFTKLKDLPEVEETYCWTIWNKDGEVELFSGFNSFYGTGSKLGKDQRRQRIDRIIECYGDDVDKNTLEDVQKRLQDYLLDSANSSSKKEEKLHIRESILSLAKMIGNEELQQELTKLIYRPMDEMYIPIPNSAQFHLEHPDFFGKGYGKIESGSSKLLLPKQERVFNLVFEPSGDSLPAYITQDNGKAIESVEKQSYLGEWILRGIFQLREYEPLTSERLKELNINGIRLTKYKGSDDIHIEFIWIDEENPPNGFIAK